MLSWKRNAENRINNSLLLLCMQENFQKMLETETLYCTLRLFEPEFHLGKNERLIPF